GLAVIVVVVEIGICRVRKDFNPYRGDRMLADVVLHRLGRDDGPLTNEERDVAPALVVYGQGDRPAAEIHLAVRPVRPDASREIKVLLGLILRHDRRDEEVIPEQPGAEV